MNAEEKNRYFQELTLNLQHEGFAVKPETEEGLLPIELDGQRLCLALDTGSVRYWREDTADDHRSAALDKAISITKTTAEYMRQMETAPQLTASGLTGDYRLLADFNDVVLAGHPTRAIAANSNSFWLDASASASRSGTLRSIGPTVDSGHFHRSSVGLLFYKKCITALFRIE